MAQEDGTLIRGREEIEGHHIQVVTTKVSKGIIIHQNKERGIMLLLNRGILEEIIGILVLHTVLIMAKEQVDLMARERVLRLWAMGSLTKGKEEVRGSQKLMGEMACKENNNLTIQHQWGIQTE